MDTIVSAMRQWADTDPDALVFTFVNKSGVHAEYTPRAVFEQAGRFASHIRRHGFVKGDVIANAIPNSPERLVTDFGIIMAGCVMVNAQVIQRDGSDFFHTANFAKCKGVVLPKNNSNASYRLFQPMIGEKVGDVVEVNVPQAPSLKKLLLCGRNSGDITDLLKRLESGKGDIFCPVASPNDLAVLFTTSGSSGFCKLVQRTHEQILKAARSFQGGKTGRYFSDRPLGWMGGFPFDYLAYCSHRILQDKFTEDYAETGTELWNVISMAKCTGAAILPLAIMDLIQAYANVKPTFKLPFIVTGGQPITKNLALAVGLLTDALIVSYSSTECAMVSFGVVTSADQMKDYFGGKPGKDVEIKIVDDNNTPVAANEKGFILIKTPFMLTNYYPTVDPTSIFTPDGYFKTGDRGTLDDSGNLFCFGRAGDVVSQGALLVYSSWPEEVLSKCPDVNDVVVLSITTSKEVLYACVVPKSGSALTKSSLTDFYRSSFMSSTTTETFMPEIEDFLIFERFPETFTGKVNKLKLKELVMEQLKLKPANTP